MLLIGDIHTTRKRIDACIDRIQGLVDVYPDDDTIVFVGDYVYHFSYDAVALHRLFAYWISLVEQGKQLYILAGNHDWIHNQFVFAESQVVFDLLQSDQMAGGIQYITRPTQMTIQGQSVIMFPYTIDLGDVPIREEYQMLGSSSHAKERLSGHANSCLHTMIDDWKANHDDSQQLLVIHHWYIAGKAFPGQFAKFGYGSPALSNHRLDDPRVRMISGHLHQPFVSGRYLCVGSIWSTSPLEINQQKYLFKYDTDTQHITAHPVSINPYYQYQTKEVEALDINQIHSRMGQHSREYLQGGQWQTHLGDQIGEVAYDQATLTLVDDAPGAIAQLTDQLRQSVGTIRTRQSKDTLDTLISSMQDASMDLDKSFNDWKSLLQEFLTAKFGDKAKQYRKDLENLEIID